MSITAKSVITDIASNHLGNYTGLNGFFFYLNGVNVSPALGSYTAYHGNYVAGYSPSTPFDPAHSVTGTGDSLVSLIMYNVFPHRLIIVFDTPLEFDEIRVCNYAFGASYTNRGAKGVKITGSTDEITDTTANATVSNSTVLFDDDLTQHIASDVADWETVYEAAITTVQVLNALEQPYDLAMTPVISALAQEYNLMFQAQNALTQLWANILEQALTQHYGDANQILAVLNQHYDDAPPVLQALIQKYDDMLAVSAALGQQYNMLFKAETSLDQRWAICSDQAVAGLVQEWDIRNQAEVMAALGQYWGLFRDRQEVLAPFFYVMADGVLLNPSEFSWTISASSSAIECTVNLADKAVWNSIQLRGNMEIHWNGRTYEFFIEGKPESKSINGKEFTANYMLEGLSVTAGLEAPYALPVTKSWPQTTMASVIVTELADGQEVDWQIDDFPVIGGTFNVVNQTPLTAIKALVGSPSVEAVVQSSHDSKLIIRREFPTSPTRWNEVKADHVIHDDGGVFSDAVTIDVQPGYNYVEISDQQESNSTKRLEPEDISTTEKRVRGYSVPWEDDFPLDTSGGSWVSIVDNGAKTELIEDVLVEFVDGTGSVSQPVYDRDLQSNFHPLIITWLLDDLGEVTASEDGSLTSEIPGNSLARITYLTKYREWTVRDDEIESVQVFIPGDEVAA